MKFRSDMDYDEWLELPWDIPYMNAQHYWWLKIWGRDEEAENFRKEYNVDITLC